MATNPDTVEKTDKGDTTKDTSNDAEPNGTTHNEDKPPSPPPPKKNKKLSNDKNIHVPKDKKLKIESVNVKAAISDNDVIYYDIHVKTAQNRWVVRKRYSEFEDLHNMVIRLSKSSSLPVLPPKHYKFFTDHSDPKFIEQRRALLDNYVRRLIKLKDISSMQPVVNFFHDSKTVHITNTNSDSNSDNKNNNNNNNNNENTDEKTNRNENDDNNNNNNNDDNNNNNGNEKLDKLVNESLSPNAKIIVKCDDDYEFPSDQEITGIEIQSLRKMSDHVLYQILVKNVHREEPYDKWTVMKRFHNIYVMDQDIRKELQNENKLDILKQMPLMPERKSKLIHDHMSEGFMEGRQVLLQNYFNKLLRIEDVAKNKTFLTFFGVEMD